MASVTERSFFIFFCFCPRKHYEGGLHLFSWSPLQICLAQFQKAICLLSNELLRIFFDFSSFPHPCLFHFLFWFFIRKSNIKQQQQQKQQQKNKTKRKRRPKKKDSVCFSIWLREARLTVKHSNKFFRRKVRKKREKESRRKLIFFHWSIVWVFPVILTQRKKNRAFFFLSLCVFFLFLNFSYERIQKSGEEKT